MTVCARQQRLVLGSPSPPIAPLPSPPPGGPARTLQSSIPICTDLPNRHGLSMCCLTCHDELEEAKDDRNPSGVSIGCKACVLEDLGGVVEHAGLAGDLLEEHEAAAHQQWPDGTLAEERPQAPCIRIITIIITITGILVTHHRAASQC